MKGLKSIWFVVCLVLAGTTVLACDLCRRNQPEVLKDVVHGTGRDIPGYNALLIVSLLIITTVALLFIRQLMNPGETRHSHIKNITIASDTP